jgi:phosphoenolpyruvate-protein phosphotransferase
MQCVAIWISLSEKQIPMSRKLKGIPAAPGIAVAPIVQFHGDLAFIPRRTIAEEDIDGEVRRLEQAMTTTSRSILFLRHEMSESLSEHDSKIYDVQVNLLHDKTFKADLVREVRVNLVNVEVALKRVVSAYEEVFNKAEDALMRERSGDIRDVGRQLLSALLDRDRSVYTADGADYIFAADEFLPSDAGILDRDHIKGIVTVRGGKYSHGAILARSLGIPALVGVEEVLSRAATGTPCVLDGESGQLIVNPDGEQLVHYHKLITERQEADARLIEVRFAPSVTLDGTEVDLMANVESVHDMRHVETAVVTGIGLFRTEFAFMERRQFPTEEEQVQMYVGAIEAAKGKPVTFRTLDIGGDKPLPYFKTPDERNPVLGWRGLRISLSWPDMLYTQIRAILRAGASGHARILLPMVTALEEVRQCREIIDTMRKDLAESGTPHDQDIEFGVMVEVPATAFILDQILPYVDFVSVGTNDLVQYLLAVDRDNPRVATLYDPYHPAVIRTLQHIASAAGLAKKPVSICGEIAGDHYYTMLLIGLGFRELSMAPVFLPRVKLMIRNFSIDEAQSIAKKAVLMSSANEIRELLKEKSRGIWSEFLGEASM